MIFPDKSLATRLENSLAQDMKGYIVALQKLSHDYTADDLAVGGGVAICMGSEFINTAVGLGLDQSVSPAELDKLEAFFHRYDVPSHIEICPFTDPEFIHLLNARAYHLKSFVTAYVYPLDSPLSTPPNLNPEIIVEPIPPDEKQIWIQTVMDISPDDKERDTRLAQAVTIREHTTCFLAKLNDEPIGASALSIRDGIGTFYFTATRNAYRNQGVQSAMIQARLKYAQAQGCEMAFATTIPGNNSMRNVMRAGFEVAYVRCMMQK